MPNEDDDEDIADANRFDEQLRQARSGGIARPQPPNISIDTTNGIATWHRQQGDSIALKPAQYEYFKLLKNAGEKQLLTFLSGQVVSASSENMPRIISHAPRAWA